MKFASHHEHLNAIVEAVNAGDPFRASALALDLAGYGDGDGVIGAYLPHAPLLRALVGALGCGPAACLDVAQDAIESENYEHARRHLALYRAHREAGAPEPWRDHSGGDESARAMEAAVRSAQ